MIIGNTSIEIIQGDSYQRNITFSGSLSDFISSVFITCQGLGLCKSLQKQEEKYIFYLSSEETSSLQEYYGSYDLTVTFIDNKIKTLCYNATIKILPKINKVECINE